MSEIWESNGRFYFILDGEKSKDYPTEESARIARIQALRDSDPERFKV